MGRLTGLAGWKQIPPNQRPVFSWRFLKPRWLAAKTAAPGTNDQRLNDVFWRAEFVLWVETAAHLCPLLFPASYKHASTAP